MVLTYTGATRKDVSGTILTDFSEWERWEHKVLSKVDNRFVSVPVNITTINELCGENIQTPEEMDQWLSINQVKY